MENKFRLKKSIAVRLFIRIVLVLGIFMAIALLANTVLLKPVYNAAKKKDLLESVEYINSFDGDYKNNLTEILKLEEQFSSKVIIYNEEEVIYMAAARLFQGEIIGGGQANQQNSANKDRYTLEPPKKPEFGIERILQQFIPRVIKESKAQDIDENTTFTILVASNKSEYFIIESALDDGSFMIIVAEMQSLKETIKIFNLFLLGTAGISLIIIIVMTYFMSRKFVEPIKNMNSVTKKISKLDFSDLCDVDTSDELEELGNSINTLSDSLETTIDDLKDELEKAKRLEELRKRFVATVSHELKTPIALMQGYSIGLSSDVCEDKDKRDYYSQVIAEEAQRLGLLVNELMDLTQLESGYIKLHEVDFELNDFLFETVEKFKAANPELDMKYISPEDELWCYADVKLMDRVIGNYLSNAVRHVDVNKKVTVEVLVQDDLYYVKVANSGENIPQDKIEEIWNSFYRVDEARNRADGGHGLGLSIVKNIQVAHRMPYGVKNVKSGVEFFFGVKKGESPNY